MGTDVRLAVAMALLERLFRELAELGIDPLESKALRKAGEELILEGIRAATSGGFSSVPMLAHSTDTGGGEAVVLALVLETRGGLREGIHDLATRLHHVRLESSEAAARARRAR